MQSYDLKDFVISNVKPEVYYAKLFPEWNPTSRPNVRCLWHDDSQPSLSIALDNGGAKCHACDKALGNIVHFESERSELEEQKAALQIYGEHYRNLIAGNMVEDFHSSLDRFDFARIAENTSLDIKTVRRFSLGIDSATGRITIPIQDQFGNYTNIRFYQLPSQRTDRTKAKIYNAKGFGYLELFPWQNIKKYSPDLPLFYMKAEKDTMLAIQHGLQAFCNTNGESAWSEGWDELFYDFNIGICGDQDDAGIKAVEKKLAILQTKCQSVCNIILPLRKRERDFADWIHSGNGSAKQFLSIYEKVRQFTVKSHPSEIQPQKPEYYSNEYQDIVSIGRNSDMLNLIIKVKGIVSAKTDKTYTVPYKFHLSSSSSPKRVWAIPFGRELIRLIKCSDDGIIEFIKKDMLGKGSKSKKIELEPLEYTTITEVEIIPVASVESDAPYVTQKCFFIGNHIDANVPYHLDIIPTTEIRSQETVGIIVGAKPISSSIDEFIFSPNRLKELEEFKVIEGQSWNGLCNIAKQIAAQFTPIRGRLDWHIVALLSWASPIQFDFPNEGRQRGWLNTLCLGDTETGKSKVTQSLQKLFNCGVFVNAENCTYVGLVGGAVKTSSGQFMLRWGRIPLCNRQLVVVEELSGLSITEISNMSEVRSSGVARLDKGGLSGETSAKTRLICLSNVRGRTKNLTGYASGILAIQELIGHGEDIARFDLICTLTNKEVPAHIINQNLYEQETFAILQAEKLKYLIQFIWALKPDQIRFTKEAYLACLEFSQKLGERYHPSCHIFQSSSGRLKLARIATAVACFQFNWNGSQIVIRPEHVDSASKLLAMLYDKESFGYLPFSEQLFYREQLRATESLESTFQHTFPTDERKRAFLQYAIHAGKFTRDEVCSVAGVQIIQADQFIGRMIGSNVLSKGEANTWEVSPLGRDWLQKKINKLHVNGKVIKIVKKDSKWLKKSG